MKLLSYYQKMDFIYPYHQAIGFYMEKAVYEESDFASTGRDGAKIQVLPIL
ncbi:hypothetical protein NXV08_00165 (plasmid) [Bacteroides fragilis]|nr:hypothetical protein [Bacteroides fragilis]